MSPVLDLDKARDSFTRACIRFRVLIYQGNEMQRWSIALWAICYLGFGVGASQSAEPGRMEKDIEFANVDGHSLKLDLYLPVDSSDAPLVVWIHGGGWQKGSKDGCEIKWLADRGFAVASISYRLTDKAQFPAQIHDCKAAVRWLRAHGEEYGINCDKVAVAGSSAGGHLAALMGTSGDVRTLEGAVGGNTDQSSRVDAVVDYYGATDFVLRSKTQPHRANEEGSVVYKLLGGGADKKVELARLASAAFHVSSDDPPFLVMHGDEDKTVLLDQSERIRDVYQKSNLPLKLHVIEGAGHGGKQFYTGEQRELVAEFLTEHLKP